VAAPLAAYVPAVQSGNQVYVSGQLPISDGTLLATGKVGADISTAAAKELAQRCGLNALAAVDALVGLDRVTRVVKVVGFGASTARASPPRALTPRALTPRVLIKERHAKSCLIRVDTRACIFLINPAGSCGRGERAADGARCLGRPRL